MVNEMLTCHPRDDLFNLNTVTGTAAQTDIQFEHANTVSFPDPLIDWLPYHYKKYIPTWHLVRSYE